MDVALEEGWTSINLGVLDLSSWTIYCILLLAQFNCSSCSVDYSICWSYCVLWNYFYIYLVDCIWSLFCLSVSSWLWLLYICLFLWKLVFLKLLFFWVDISILVCIVVWVISSKLLLLFILLYLECSELYSYFVFSILFPVLLNCFFLII